MLNSCKDDELSDGSEQFEKGYALNKFVTHTHVKGTDPCPQDFSEDQSVKIRCKYEYSDSTCGADSVVVTNPSIGLIAQFKSNKKGQIKLIPIVERELQFKFTCNIAESFKHTYTLVYYLKGVEVATEDIQVDVTVLE